MCILDKGTKVVTAIMVGRGGGQYRTCAEWDASGVFLPLSKWHALVKHLDGVKTDGGTSHA